MRSLLAALLGAAALAGFSPAGLAQDASALSGTWRGNYSYQSGASQREVAFTLELRVSGTSVAGRITEPNTFGDKSAANLYANVAGIVEGRRVRLVKTYDGTGGANHSVYYEGILDAGSTSSAGRWTISDQWGGEFRVSRN